MSCPHGMPTPGSCVECLPVRIRTKIEVQTNGCWWWTAALGDHGYGMVWDGARMVGAHRYVWETLVGPIPDGLHLDHSQGCSTRRCVRPGCLEAVPQRVNNERLRQSTCRRGHPWTLESTYIRPDTGARTCRVCAADRARERART